MNHTPQTLNPQLQPPKEGAYLRILMFELAWCAARVSIYGGSPQNLKDEINQQFMHLLFFRIWGTNPKH